MTFSREKDASRPGWLIVLGDQEGLEWVLDKERVAFSQGACSRARSIEAGDTLVFYRTRGAFRNPTRDASQLIAVGIAAADVESFRRPVKIGGREFRCGCPVEFELTLPERDGLDAAPLMKHLSFVKKPKVWGQYVRSSPIRLPPNDLKLLSDELRRYAGAQR